MDYVCDHMRKVVIYDQETISVTLTRCGECIGCFLSRVEMSRYSSAILEEAGNLLSQPRFEGATITIREDKEK